MIQLTLDERLAIIATHEHEWLAQKESHELALRIHEKIKSDKPVLEAIAKKIVMCEDALKVLEEERAALTPSTPNSE